MDIKLAFEKAERFESKIPSEYISKLTGLASPRVWHLLNNLCSDATNYLEIGTYMGSSLLAATYKNNVRATAIDNFCMKPHTRNHFFQNVKHLQNLNFIEGDCFKLDQSNIPVCDVYFYDGRHEYEDQYKALTHYIDYVKDEFIYICDDWNMSDVGLATMEAIKDLRLEVIDCEIRKNEVMKDVKGWWCGIAVFKLRKP